MDNIQIRTADSDDFPAIAGLLQSHGLPVEGVREHLVDFRVAVDDNQRLGGVIGIERYGAYGLLRSVAVAERNGGLGSELVKSAIEAAREAGIRRLVLLTTTAAAYFPRFGFKTISRQDAPEAVKVSVEFTGACPDSAVVMALDLMEEVTA